MQFGAFVNQNHRERYEGMTQPAAAKVLGVSLATLKRRWQAARLELSEQLKAIWIGQ